MGRGCLILAFVLLSASSTFPESFEARNHDPQGIIHPSRGQADLAIPEYQEATALEHEYGWAVSISREAIGI